MASSSKNEKVNLDNKIESTCRLSTHLYKVLGLVGANEDIRNTHKEKAATREVLETAINGITDPGTLISVYMFGSSYEGTPIQGLQSDLNVLHCIEYLPVVEHIDDAPQYGLALLMVSDADTKPGYVQLQTVINKLPQTIDDREPTHIEFKDTNGRFLHKHFPIPQNLDRHGPADHYPETEAINEQEYVNAFRSRTIPSFADEWLHRSRSYQWPREAQLHRMRSYGCFYVGVGNPKSQNKEIEWRISFSLQERDLMASLNSTQHKCYVLLKMIKKDIIHPMVGHKSISSYHCKTCLFHVVENSSTHLWTSQNLMFKMQECLRLLLHWAKERNCPNYFIKGENMFDRIDDETLNNVARVLLSLLESGGSFLFTLNCDSVGILLEKSVKDEALNEIRLEMQRTLKLDLYIFIVKTLLWQRFLLFRYITEAVSPPNCLSRAVEILRKLDQTFAITEHRPIQVKIVLHRLTLHIHLIVAQSIAAIALMNTRGNHFADLIKDFEKNVENGKDCDLICERLILATVCLQTSELERCENLLRQCAASLSSSVISMCGCHCHHNFVRGALREKLTSENMSLRQFQKECLTACIIFLPFQANIVHPALQYEMFRSVNTPAGSRDEGRHFWFDWIAIDSAAYIYFLTYIMYTKTDKAVYKQDALDKLRDLVDTDPNLGHRETAYNLLGWMYSQEGEHKEAFECFRLSWSIRPVHNAAIWHILMLIHSLLDTEIIYDRRRFTE